MREDRIELEVEGWLRYGPLKNTSEEARDFVSRAIKAHIAKGMKKDQAIAVALKEAREKGYSV